MLGLQLTEMSARIRRSVGNPLGSAKLTDKLSQLDMSNLLVIVHKLKKEGLAVPKFTNEHHSTKEFLLQYCDFVGKFLVGGLFEQAKSAAAEIVGDRPATD